MSTLVALVAAALVAVASIYLWMRNPGDADLEHPWPELSPGHTPVGAGRDFATLSLAESLDRAGQDPARGAATAATIHRRLAAVVEARLAARAGDEHRLPAADLSVLLDFLDSPPDTVALTDPGLLDELLVRIEAL